jgi:hypothetical protein
LQGRQGNLTEKTARIFVIGAENVVLHQRRSTARFFETFALSDVSNRYVTLRMLIILANGYALAIRVVIGNFQAREKGKML